MVKLILINYVGHDSFFLGVFDKYLHKKQKIISVSQEEQRLKLTRKISGDQDSGTFMPYQLTVPL